MLKAQGQFGVNVIDSLRRDVLGGMKEGEADRQIAEERERSVELAKARIKEYESVQNKRLARYSNVDHPDHSFSVQIPQEGEGVLTLDARQRRRQERSFRWDRAEIDRRVLRANAVVATTGLTATVFALAQNELVFRDAAIDGALMQGLKAGSMLLCMVTCSVRTRDHGR